MGKNYVLKTKTGHIKLSPCLFAKYANDCFEAAKFFKDQKKFSPVPYYLYCKNIELSLKAFLLYYGIELQKLKKKPYGHNLKKLLAEAKKYDLKKIFSVTSLEEKELEKASLLYDNPNKAFEYSRAIDAVRRYKDFPELKSIKRLAKKMLKISVFVK